MAHLCHFLHMKSCRYKPVALFSLSKYVVSHYSFVNPNNNGFKITKKVHKKHFLWTFYCGNIEGSGIYISIYDFKDLHRLHPFENHLVNLTSKNLWFFAFESNSHLIATYLISSCNRLCHFNLFQSHSPVLITFIHIC